MGQTSRRIVLAAATAFCGGNAWAAAKTYSYTSILVPGSVQTFAVAINTAGTVVGGWDDDTYTEHGFIFQNGTVTSFDAPDAVNGTVPSSISASGEIVGTYFDANYGQHGFTYVPATGTFTTVDKPGTNGTRLAGIDSKGVIFGVASGTGNQQIVFSYANSKFKTLPIGGTPIVYAVSDKGAIAGAYFNTSPFTAYLYAHGVATTLPLNAPGGAAAFGVNAADVVVGETSSDSNVETGFIYANGTATSVALNGAVNTSLTAINDAGIAVGVGYDQYFDVLGSFVYDKGKITAMSEPNGTSTAATAINKAGQVVGSYQDNTNGPAAFLATPE